MVFRPSLTRRAQPRPEAIRWKADLMRGRMRGRRCGYPPYHWVCSPPPGGTSGAVRELALTLLPATAPAVHRARQILGADDLADLQHEFCDLTISH